MAAELRESDTQDGHRVPRLCLLILKPMPIDQGQKEKEKNTTIFSTEARRTHIYLLLGNVIRSRCQVPNTVTAYKTKTTIERASPCPCPSPSPSLYPWLRDSYFVHTTLYPPPQPRQHRQTEENPTRGSGRENCRLASWVREQDPSPLST